MRPAGSPLILPRPITAPIPIAGAAFYTLLYVYAHRVNEALLSLESEPPLPPGPSAYEVLDFLIKFVRKAFKIGVRKLL